MRREVVENVYRVYIWQVARAVGNKDLKKTLCVQFEMDNGLKQELELTLSRTNFGGMRLWFLCPGCGLRVGAVYFPQQTAHFACRHCHGLRYEVQTKHRDSFYETVEKPLKKMNAAKGN